MRFGRFFKSFCWVLTDSHQPIFQLKRKINTWDFRLIFNLTHNWIDVFIFEYMYSKRTHSLVQIVWCFLFSTYDSKWNHQPDHDLDMRHCMICIRTYPQTHTHTHLVVHFIQNTFFSAVIVFNSAIEIGNSIKIHISFGNVKSDKNTSSCAQTKQFHSFVHTQTKWQTR